MNMQPILLRPLPALLIILALGLSACNPSGTGYYLFKGVWNKKLKQEARISLFQDAAAMLNYSGDSTPEFLNEGAQQEYSADFEGDMKLNMENATNVVSTHIDAEFELTIIQLDLNESCRLEICEEEEFQLTELEVYVEYILKVIATGEVLEEGTARVSEGEGLKTKTPDDSAPYCVKKLRSLSFDNLLDRAADKVVAKMTNDIVKYRKKG